MFQQLEHLAPGRGQAYVRYIIHDSSMWNNDAVLMETIRRAAATELAAHLTGTHVPHAKMMDGSRVPSPPHRRV
jgi:hypothetical protein